MCVHPIYLVKITQQLFPMQAYVAGEGTVRVIARPGTGFYIRAQTANYTLYLHYKSVWLDPNLDILYLVTVNAKLKTSEMCIISTDLSH